VTDADLFKLLGGGGFAAALLYLLYLVGSRMVAAIDRVAAKVDGHTKDDLASHAEMRDQITRLDAKLDANLDAADRYTPVGVEIPEPPRRTRTNPQGVQIGGYYGPSRPGTKGG
jgi:hypothetical protein